MRWWQVMHVLTVTILQHRQSNRIMRSILPHRKRVKDLAYPLNYISPNQLSGAAGSKARSWFSSSQCHCAIFPEGGCKHSLNQPSLQESTRYGCRTIYISLFIRPTRRLRRWRWTTRETAWNIKVSHSFLSYLLKTQCKAHLHRRLRYLSLDVVLGVCTRGGRSVKATFLSWNALWHSTKRYCFT